MGKVTMTFKVPPKPKQLTAQEFAAMLHGREYGSELTSEEAALAKANGLVVIYGYSDDNVELRGAIDDELGAYGGLDFSIGKHGVVKKWEDMDHSDEDACREYFENKGKGTIDIGADWDTEGYSWRIEADCDERFVGCFDIMEDGEKFCRGIVLYMRCLND